MPREVFINSKPVDQERDHTPIAEIKKAREEHTIEVSGISVEQFNSYKETFLKGVDFEKLRTIFTNIYRRSGFDPQTMNFIGPEGIILFQPAGVRGMYEVGRNCISIAPENMLMPIEDGRSYERAFFNMILALIHEQTHAVSKNISSAQYRGDYEQSKTMQTGYTVMMNGARRFFEQFNEGVVEKLARQIADEYFEQVGWTKEDVEAYKKRKEEHPETMHYAENIQTVEFIVDRVSEFAGVSKTTVFEALVSGLMHGEIFKEEEVKDLFAQAFGWDFLSRLSTLNTHPFSVENMANLMARYKKSSAQ